MARLYIPIWNDKRVIAIGVYAHKRDAQYAIIDYIFNYESKLKNTITADVKSNFKVQLADKESWYQAVFKNNDNLSSYLTDDIPADVEIATARFDFRMYSKWDPDSLYELQDAVLHGRIGAGGAGIGYKIYHCIDNDKW